MRCAPDLASTGRAVVAFLATFMALHPLALRISFERELAFPAPLLTLLLALPLALLFEPRETADASGGLTLVRGASPARPRGAPWIALAVSAAAALVAGVVWAALRGPGADARPCSTLEAMTRVGSLPLAALASALVALPGPGVLLAARQASLRLPTQAAGGAAALLIPAVVLVPLPGVAWLAIVGGAAMGCGVWLTDRRERGVDRQGALLDSRGIGPARALPPLLVALLLPPLTSLLWTRGLEAGSTVGSTLDVPRVLGETASAIELHVLRTGSTPESLPEVAGVLPGIACGLHEGYLFRYSRGPNGWWGLAADSADRIAAGPSFRKVAGNPVEAGASPFPLEGR